MKPTIYTIGYSGSSPQDIHQFLDELDAVLVDIRYSPSSRRPEWRGGTLYSTLPKGKYTWARSLGNRNYNNDGPIELDDPQMGLALVRALTHSCSVILMCACRDVERCHRKVAAEFLAGQLGLPVVHLPSTVAEWRGPHGSESESARAASSTEGKRELRCLSLIQPWASLIALGAKKIETRSWSTRYRGLLAIHASSAKVDAELCREEPFRSALYHGGIRSVSGIPRGCIVAVADLVDCVPTEKLKPGFPESAFGDYSPGRYGWVLGGVLRLPEPIPAKGTLGLWLPDNELRAKIEAVVPGARASR